MPERGPLDVSVSLCTADQPGAVALLLLSGEHTVEALRRITGLSDWPITRLRLADLAGVDRGLAGRLSQRQAQLMPHGGPWLVRKLLDRLVELGIAYEDSPRPESVYPEASCRLEAHALAALAQSPSPAAVAPLLAQPKLWRAWLEQPAEERPTPAELFKRSGRLQRLLSPPSVVVTGEPNAGKSTLTNALLGRSVSLVSDLPGTTRDWVAQLAELGPAQRAVAVRWIDTPGLRRSDDPVEQAAIGIARRVLTSAEVLIAMREPGGDWPAADNLGRTPDLWLLSKADRLQGRAMLDLGAGSGQTADNPLRISATTGRGLDELIWVVLGCLELDRPIQPEPWAFCSPLSDALQERDAQATERAVRALLFG